MSRIIKEGLLLVVCSLGGAILFGSPAMAANSVKSGQLTVERPTLVAAGFDWRISGDDNHNAKIEIAYRKKGESTWHDGLPLLREGDGEIVGVSPPRAPAPGAAEQEPPFQQFKYHVPDMFAGSIFGLAPDTDYEARLTLTDPDGGGTSKIVSVHTRPEPMPAKGGHVYNVYPVDWKGPKQNPAFTGLMNAYYMRGISDDYENAYPPRVQPGDIILVHGGTYVGDQYHYMNGQPHPGYDALGTLFDGTYYLTANGTPDKPIVIKAAGDGEVVFDGNGAENLFDLMGGNYNYFEGITVRNTNVAFLLGIKGIGGSSGFTLKHSKVYNVGRVVQDDWSASKDYYIADNDFDGRHDPMHMMSWSGARWEQFPGFPEVVGGEKGSEYAVKVYGQGHVVAYNRVTNFHDAIDVATFGVPDGVTLPDGSSAHEIEDHFPESIDFYGNYISEMGDNCFEMDGGGRNIRAFDNFCFNLGSTALSVQPGFGGPFYWIRNVIYNAGGAFKYIENSSGILTYNNTIVAEGRATPAQNMHFRNNLILGDGLNNPVFEVNSTSNTNDADYDGFRPNPGNADAFEWDTPPDGVVHDYDHQPVTRKFKTLADMVAATGQEKHGVLVDYNIFQHVTPPNIDDPQRVYNSADYDFRLKPGTAAIDAGVVLPNVTDGFSGKAPDLGAYELGAPLPHYGPRDETAAK